VREALVRADLLAKFESLEGAERREGAPPVIDGVLFPSTNTKEMQP
jgi:hypothetical protein